MDNKVSAFGFGGQSRDLSKIEKDLGIVFDNSRVPEGLAAQRGKFLQIFIDGHQIPGMYRGTTRDGEHVIQPSLLPGPDYFKNGATPFERHIWKDVASLHKGNYEGFTPASKSFLEACGSNFSEVAGLGSFLEF